MDQPQRRLIAHILMVITVLFWGNAFIAIKFSLRQLDPFTLTALRFLLASLFFFLTMLVIYRKLPRPTFREIPRLVALSLVGGAVYHVALNYGEQFIPAGSASLIIGSSPIFTAILAFLFLRERVTLVRIAGILLSFLGLFLISWKGTGQELNFTNLQGVLAVLLATLCWSTYPILAKPAVIRRGPLFVSSYMQFFALVLILPWNILPLSQVLNSLSPMTWVAVTFLASVCTVLGYIFYNQSLQVLGATATSSYLYLVPVVGVLFGWLLLGEPVNLFLFLGGLLVIAGVVMANLRPRIARSVS